MINLQPELEGVHLIHLVLDFGAENEPLPAIYNVQ